MNKKKIVVTGFVLLLTAAAWCQDTKVTPSLNHIAQYVVNLKVSSDFYQNIIGLDTIPEPFHDGKHTWFAVGPKSHLHIISGAQEKIPHDKNSHLCFTVPSVLDFIAKLKKNNVAFESWLGEKNTFTNRVDGVKQIYFQDPDGYWIEINDATR
jgi:lactoylglutathione lyase